MKTLFGLLVICVLLIVLLPLATAEQERLVVPGVVLNICTNRIIKVVSIPKEAQPEDRSWCWAAAAKNVMASHGFVKSQCELVARTYGKDCCGADAGQFECMANGWPEYIFEAMTPPWGYSPPWGTPQPTILKWGAVTEQICSNGPYISTINGVLHTLHSIVVHGFVQVSGIWSPFPIKRILVYDPQDDYSFSISYKGHIGGSMYKHIGDTYEIIKP